MRRLVWPVLFGLVGTLILVGLGVWQLERLGRKEAMLAEIDARIGQSPVPLPETPDPVRDRYLPVTLSGAFTSDELLVISSRQNVGPGYRLVTPFVTAKGRRVLVDRGFLAETERALPRPAGPARITGNLQWPNEADSYTPPPDAKTGLWFARDVAKMAALLETEPVMVVLRTTDETSAAAMLSPVDSSGFPNNHLQYAITWFLLAVIWAGMTVTLVWRIRRQDR